MFRKNIKTNWWEDIFDQKYLDTYIDINTPTSTDREIRFLEKNFNLVGAVNILDLACGYGRHSIPLAKLGYKVTGIDYSDYFLNLAKDSAKKEKVIINFKKENMIDFDTTEQFDAIINMFTSFGYFDNMSDNKKVLSNVYQSLKKGGIFILDFNNIFKTVTRVGNDGKITKNGIIENEYMEDLSNGLNVKTENIIDLVTQTWEIKRTWQDSSNKNQTYAAKFRLFTPYEIKMLLIDTGFIVLDYFGDFDNSFFDFKSPRFIILVKK